jgi:hypothetical protein
MDPQSKLGVFDINMIQGANSQTQVYCFAASVDKATNSSTYGRLICVDASSKSPKITLIQQ